MSARALVVLVSAPDLEAAERLGTRLVEERLAACVNVIPALSSIYRWEGRVERAEEALLVVKTTAEGAAALQARVVELHPYEVPEFLALDVVGGHEPYLEWVSAAVGRVSGE